MSPTADPSADLQRTLAGCSAAHRALEADLVGLTDSNMRQPSLLAGWTVGHVLTHIARNGESFVRLIEAAREGGGGAQYPGGREQRNNDIEAGASRGAVAIIDDVIATNAAFDEAAASLPETAWGVDVAFMVGNGSARDIAWRRLREVAVHHIDLGLATTWREWPLEYVRPELQRMTMLWASRRPMGLTTLPDAALRADDHLRLAWLLGRAEIDGLEAAGVMA
jgi:maleylpyruvate isomerase